jgi:xylitol oxidase
VTSADPADDRSAPRYNWSRTVRYRAARVHHPRSVEELQQVVRGSGRVRPLGTRHSFNHIADGDGDQVALDEMPARVRIDPAAGTATVAAGLPYVTVAERLAAAGYALSAMASLPHISVAGACATATHGSGDRVGGLATAVLGIELVNGRGRLVRASLAGDPEMFPGMVVGLGALGVVTELTLAVEPSYRVAQTVYLDLPGELLAERFERIYRSAYSVSCFTRWRHDTVDQVWLKQRLADASGEPQIGDGAGIGDPRASGDGPGRGAPIAALLAPARPAAAPVNPVPGSDPADCTEQGGVPGSWHERLPHFRAGHRPSSGDEIQSEYFVPRAHAPAAIRALFGIGDRLAGALQIGEIRTVAADDLWLSPAYRQHCVAFHFTWTSDADAVLRALPSIERALQPFGAVPHWGKVFTAGPEVFPGRYRRLADFADLVRRFDPDRRFGNDFLDRYVLGASG